MRKFKVFLSINLVFLFVLLVFSFQAQALSVGPGDAIYTGADNPAWAVWNTSSVIPIIESLISGEELWKSDDNAQPLAGSYTSSLTATGGTITHVDGTTTVDAPAYLFLLDGSHSPHWYLINLTDLLWDGEEQLELSGFFPLGGSISHGSLWGTYTPPVPEPATMILLGSGLLGLAGVSRRFRKK